MTIKAGVMGWPVEHSRSPALHGFWLKAYGIDGTYEKLAVKPEDLAAALRALPEKGFAGVNLTVPHKEAAMKIVDSISGVAANIEAINTIFVESDGSLTGHNTDVYGFITNLEVGAPELDYQGGPAIVLGAGGAARAVCFALMSRVPEIILINRTTDRAENLAKTLCGNIRIVAWDNRAAALKNAALLVNTTTQGMQGQPPLEIDLQNLPLEAVVSDIVYTPLETPLLAAARVRGNTIVDGLGMLLYQAQPGFEGWFGKRPEVTKALRDYVLGSKTRAAD